MAVRTKAWRIRCHLNEVLSIRAQEFSNRARIGTRLRHLNEVLSIRAQE